ncbi:MAG: putative toxin-antitoxin system toxin component, PIN family [Myxococcaceae bacterium]
MRVVLDTNVIMSGIFWSGPTEKILKLWSQGKFRLLISLSVFDEYKEIVQRLSQKYELKSADSILHDIFLGSELVEPNEESVPDCEDIDDIMFLELAVAGKADYLVSGDKHLLRVKEYKGGKIVKPSDFISLF